MIFYFILVTIERHLSVMICIEYGLERNVKEEQALFQNNNKEVIKRISKASLKSSTMRNRLIGIVIMLAAFLLTLASTFGYNAAMEMKNRTSYQGVIDNVDKEVIERIRLNPDIVAFGTYLKVGMAKNEAISISLLYSDIKMMELSNVKMRTGSLPQNTDQIAIEKGYLETIKSGAQIGDNITLNYRNDVSKEMQKKNFTITGFLETGAENDANRKTFNAVVSKAFINSDPALSSSELSVAIRIADSEKYSNAEMKAKIKEIGNAVGIPEGLVNINYINIDSNNTTSETSYVVIAIAIVIIIACTLVIYNIFYIAILRRVNEYGQLRIIGTTRRQIRRIVFREGRQLSIQYIPVGILSGCGVSYLLRPSMWITLSDLVLSIIAGFITFLTVMLSLRKPAVIAASVSPKEALCYTDINIDTKNKKFTGRQLTPITLGKMYLQRNRKKTTVTFLSLTLSGILLIATATLAFSVDPYRRAGHEFPYGGEYILRLNNDLISPSVHYNDLQQDNPLTDELEAKIAAVLGVDGVETHKYIRSKLEGVEIDGGIVGIDNIRSKDSSIFEKYLAEGALPNDLTEKAPQILVNRATATYEYFGLHYKTGDRIVMSLFDGDKRIKREFTVSGIIDNKNNSDTFFLQDEVMDEIMLQNCNLSFEIRCSQGYSADIEAQLKALTASEDKLEIVTRKDQRDLYKSVFRTMTIAVYTFVAIIACFSLVNLINTILTNILTRKNELGILQAVGLSRGQMIKMLNTENIYLTYGSFIASVFFGSILGYIICLASENVGGLSYFIQYKFPFLIILMYFILITMIQGVMTWIIGYSMKKMSVVERLREV